VTIEIFLSGMEQEARIGYLCYQEARNALTIDEECELLGYAALEPQILNLIENDIYFCGYGLLEYSVLIE